MNFLRKIYIKTTNLTHGYQDKQSKIISFYKLWAPFYDISIKIDPAYNRNLKKMIDSTVSMGDHTLDIGCGTGFGTIYAARIAHKVLGIDSSKHMLSKLRKKTNKYKIHNINIKEGFFPQVLKTDNKFTSIISSFMLAHFSEKQRTQAIKDMSNILQTNGRIGLFSAQGEIASAFQSKEEIEKNLTSAGFHNILIT